MVKKLLKDDHPVNKKKILKAAIEVFSKKGYQRTTIREISTKSGLSIGTIYFHFENKEEILKEVLKNTELIAMSSVMEQIDSMEPYDIIKKINREITKNMAANFETLLLLINTSKDNPKFNSFFYEQFRSKTGEIAELIKELIKRGSIRKVNPENAAIFLIGNVFTMVILKENILKKNLENTYYEEMNEFIMDMLKNGFFKK
ncbi:MAG: TetR/AcrR family transcriptional regulator [Candidatus Wallbacteria bacterium]